MFLQWISVQWGRFQAVGQPLQALPGPFACACICLWLCLRPTSPTPHALGSCAMLDSAHHGLIVPPPVSPHCPLSLGHRRPVAYFPVPLTWACPPPTSGRQRKGKNLGGNLPPSRAHSDSVGRWTLLLVPQLPLGTCSSPRVALGQN